MCRCHQAPKMKQHVNDSEGVEHMQVHRHACWNLNSIALPASALAISTASAPEIGAYTYERGELTGLTVFGGQPMTCK